MNYSQTSISVLKYTTGANVMKLVACGEGRRMLTSELAFSHISDIKTFGVFNDTERCEIREWMGYAKQFLRKDKQLFGSNRANANHITGGAIYLCEPLEELTSGTCVLCTLRLKTSHSCHLKSLNEF
jgi:hypothetical protein